MCNRLCQLFHYRLTDFSFHYYCSLSHRQWQKTPCSHTHTDTQTHTHTPDTYTQTASLHTATSSSPSIKEAICSSGSTWAKRQVGGYALFTYQTPLGVRCHWFYFCPCLHDVSSAFLSACMSVGCVLCVCVCVCVCV